MFPTLERSFLALDWDPDLKKRYFDENAAEVSHYSLMLYLLITVCYTVLLLPHVYFVRQLVCTRKEKVRWF